MGTETKLLFLNLVDAGQIGPDTLAWLGHELYGHVTRGKFSWQKPTAELLGIGPRQLRNLLDGTCSLNKRRKTQAKRIIEALAHRRLERVPANLVR